MIRYIRYTPEIFLSDFNSYNLVIQVAILGESNFAYSYCLTLNHKGIGINHIEAGKQLYSFLENTFKLCKPSSTPPPCKGHFVNLF